jgi:hypothetical protein
VEIFLEPTARDTKEKITNRSNKESFSMDEK